MTLSENELLAKFELSSQAYLPSYTHKVYSVTLLSCNFRYALRTLLVYNKCFLGCLDC